MISLAHIVSMECVDQIKISPHEPVIAVYAVEAAPNDAAPGIKFSPCSEAVLLEQFGRHAARLKGNAIVAVAIIQPPTVVKQTPFIL